MSATSGVRTTVKGIMGMGLASLMLVSGCGTDKGETGTQVPKAAVDPTIAAQDSLNAYRKEHNIPNPAKPSP